MRRILSILFTLVLSLGPAAASVPSQAMASGWTGKVDESRIPACCRRNGAHHCAMSQEVRTREVGSRKVRQLEVKGQDLSGETSVSAHICCPSMPAAPASVTTPVAAMPTAGEASGARITDFSATQTYLESEHAIVLRAHLKRGPPSQTL